MMPFENVVLEVMEGDWKASPGRHRISRPGSYSSNHEL
jgi:hypothetical protein